ncbi:MAG: DUF3147 domain-containing protein [Nitrospirae bacterium]|nr:MAG: DUF3147 domain-containing protein [Nitrospirota bacterium]
MSELLKPMLYFVLGGTIVSLSSYVGAQGRGFLAAFVSTFPAITGVTLILIYLNGGIDPAANYARHLLWFVIPWVAYVTMLIVALPRINFWFAWVGALMLYMALIAVTKLALR